MRDYDLPPPEIEAKARSLDPSAWASSDSTGEAFSFRYRRYRARAAAGWPNSHYPAESPPLGSERSDEGNPATDEPIPPTTTGEGR